MTREEALERIQSYTVLESNWDGEHAPPPSLIACSRAYIVVSTVVVVPDVFPTARESVQLEYINGERELEVEVYQDHFSYLIMDDCGKSYTEYEETDILRVIEVMDKFMGANR